MTSGVARAPQHLSRPGRFVQYYIRQRAGQFATLFGIVVGAAACAVAMQYQMKELIDAMTGSRRLAAVWTALVVFAMLMGAESVLWRVCAWMSCRATIEVGVRMRLDLFDYLSGQSIRYFAEHLAGSLGQRITGTAGNFGALSNTVMWRIVPPIVDFFGALVIFTLIAWPMAASLGLFATVATTALILAGQRGRAVHTAYFARASIAAGNITDVISNMWAIKAFSARRREWQRLAEEFHSEADAQRRSWMYTEKTRMGYDFALWVMSAAMSFWAVHSWSMQTITSGDVVIVTALTFRILHGSRDVALALVDVGQQFGYIDDTLKVIGKVHTLTDSPLATARTPGSSKIAFRNVTFGYDPARPILRDVNFEIRSGEKVGIVGASGAGKTTVVQLLQRLHDIQVGEITIDDTPVAMFTQDSLRALMSVVPQEIGLFHRSVMDNIRFARPDATDAEVFAAARAARCDEFVQRLPDGFATLVGERGVKLSGGQRQRVGIARAFLKDAPVLILDEATSALDTTSEIEVQRSVIQLVRNCTVIAVAHRLSTLAAFDRILVIDAGRVVEDGTPADLRRNGKLFGSMWRMQSEGLGPDISGSRATSVARARPRR
jgi:ATP-binding cassette subfamily B protein